MHKLITPILMIAVLAACTGTKSDVTALLERADSIMESCPDSAYTLLNNIDSVIVSNLSRAESARYYLLLGTAMNKTDRPMAFDSLFNKQVVDYYDRHGTSNEQMRARYIMGSICRDMHEAPRAIEWYLSATERADTLATDCDYLTLMRIYGQMAEVYIRQMMPEETIESNRQYSKCAAKCGNTYEYIRGIELQLDGYNTLGNSRMIFALTDSVRHLYLQNDMSQAAARVYPTAIIAHLNLHNYAEAKHMMDIFETESGLFDSDGNIQREYASYYPIKGLYYKGIGQLDSAEYYYRKSISKGFDLSGNRGLFDIYLSRNNTDSISIYGSAYEQALAEFEKNTNIQAVHNISALYNYNRQRQKAQDLELRVQKWEYNMLIVCLLSVVLIIYFVCKWRNQKKQKKEAVEKLYTELISFKSALAIKTEQIEKLNHDKERKESIGTEEFESLKHLLYETEEKLQAKVSEADKLTIDMKHVKEKSTDEIRELSEKLELANRIMLGVINYEDESPIKESAIFKKMVDKANNPGNVIISDTQWKTFYDLCSKHMPKLCQKMTGCELTYYQKSVALLVRLGFSNGDIARIMDKNKQNIRSFKASANKNLFGVYSAELLHDNLMLFYGNNKDTMPV